MHVRNVIDSGLQDHWISRFEVVSTDEVHKNGFQLAAEILVLEILIGFAVGRV